MATYVVFSIFYRGVPVKRHRNCIYFRKQLKSFSSEKSYLITNPIQKSQYTGVQYHKP